ncbi:VLRF1 family aeRF1-type release factor [Synechococcus sp. H55.10]|uniref:VLRF1 family aeRF1-type release factor n=2 Tax=unclassified Synechococcus TaxID=2626047 RepID=UPI0039C722F0
MDELNTLIRDLQAAFGDSSTPVLSLYADINPARPENARLAWVGRIKNAIKELPEFREGKRDPSLYEQILALLEQERPSARTLVLFASRNADGKLVLRRIDLQVELPVVDLAHGRVEARWGEPYLTPLIFAFDEYERAGVLHLSGARWHFYELFLGELREDTEVFANISADEWRELQELAGRIENVVAERRARSGGTFDKLSPKEREAAKVSLWMHKLYQRLAQALDKAVDRLGIERLVLMGEAWQVSHFEGYLNRGLRNRIVARVGHPTNFHAPTPQDILERVLPVLEAAERRGELALLERIREQPGAWGVDAVLDALQLGRVEILVLPWRLETTIWRCPDGSVGGTQEMARLLCPEPQPVALRDQVWVLARDFGAKLEFVRGEAEDRLLHEFQGAAALLRW